MWARTGFILLILGTCQVLSDYVPATYRENIQNNDGNSMSRIVSGWPAQPGQHPHQVHVRMTNALGQMSSCGGSVVHRSWVITAAHCTAQQVLVTIRAGTVDLTQLPEYLEDSRDWSSFPSYDTSRPLVVQPNDISVVRLPRELTYTAALQPIRLQTFADAYKDYAGEVLVASGYGRTWTNGATSNALNWVYLRGITNSDCSWIFGASLITNTAICAQFYNVTSQSICQGDSGGPLVQIEADGKATLIGISSFVAGGSFGCHSEHPGGFIRPGPFHGWLTEVTGVEFENLDESEPTEPPTEAPTTTPPTDAPTTLPPTDAPTTLPPTDAPTTVPPTDAPTTLPPTEEPTTTEAPTTSAATTTPEPEEKPEESTEKPDSNESDSSSSEEDLKDLLKRLEVMVNVKVKMDKYKTKHKVHKALHH